MTSPTPAQPAPSLRVDLVGGDHFDLAEAAPDTFTMVVFYRGLHCPVCKGYNRTLDKLKSDYAERGVEVVAISMDDQATAETTVEEWGIQDLRVGHGLSEDVAREWGLYVSTAIKDGEPDRFSEPGLFLVRPDGTLYYAAVNSMPFGRPDLEDLLGGLDFIAENDYPPRGVA